MGSTVTIQAEIEENESENIFNQIVTCFKELEKTASRFNPESELSYLNSNLSYTVEVSETLKDLLKEAYHAYQLTGGAFDPRILTTLSNVGYSENFNDNQFNTKESKPFIIKETWNPSLDSGKVFVGEHPIDLGGIAKSYTVWKASLIMQKYSDNFFINAGGDITFQGLDPNGNKWTVGVENPFNISDTTPLAVLELKNKAIATSSIAKRTWTDKNNQTMHHIINPSTGLPADNGTVSITIIHSDIVTAETWSKSLFLEPADQIAEFTESLQLPALWFTTDKQMHYNSFMKKHVTWTI